MSDDSKISQKITGYLEKRGKLKLMNTWKRYWFVLEGHLLLYYGSKEDYDALSPCRGSITLGPTCTVRPYPSTPLKFQITTRSGCVTTLRAESISEQNKWMQAIFSSVNENQKVDISPTKLCHFRYSTERVDLIMNNADLQRSSNSPVQKESDKSPSKTLERDETQLLERLQRIGARSYCDSIVPTQQKLTNKSQKPKNLDNTSIERGFPNENSYTKETATSSPKRLQFSPKISKINEEKVSLEKEEEVILEDDDFCVCTLEKDGGTGGSVQRSISFTEAREVFNRQQPETTHLLKMKEKITQDQKNKGEIKQSPEEGKKIDEILENREITENGNDDKLEEENNNASRVTENAETDIDKKARRNENLDEDEFHEKLSELSKKPSQISLLGTFYNNENPEEAHLSYQDFRENELYVLQPRGNHTSASGRVREETARLHFPPPPSEAYRSMDDIIQQQEEEESLYEEAEDYIWQNEIYESSVDQTETISSKTQSNNQNKFPNEKTTKKNVESDDDLYEEVDEDFVYTNMEFGEDEEIYSKPNFLGFFKKSLSYSDDSNPEMYEEVDVQSSREKRNSDQQEENELYEDTRKIFTFDQRNENKKLNGNSDSKVHENEANDVQVENDLYEDPKEFYVDFDEEMQLDNEIYAQPRMHETATKKHNSSGELQIDNELYTEPNFNSLKNNENNIQFRQTTGTTTKTPKEDEVNELKKEVIEQTKKKEEQMVGVIENNIYSEPSLVFQRERHSSVESEANVYEDPDQLMLRSGKKEKKRKQQKSEELRKQDNFIQRLLKQVTRKHTEKSGKTGSDNADETLKLLGDIQVLLEKKKQFIKDMVENEKSTANHRRILSEANAQITDKDGDKALMRTYSVDLNDEYSVVRDCLQDDNEVIYSEVEMIDRSSKELKDLIEDLLKHYRESTGKEEKG